jgi:catechol 2,3-dioxygenase-like lactoylglutathione lyase family enzyme
MTAYQTPIKGLHHAAFRCRDSEETRRFYEDFLGLRLAGALAIDTTKSGRSTNVLHTFFEMGDGSYLAFFEVPDRPFDFKTQHDFDLHIALEADERDLMHLFEQAEQRGIERRGVSDHTFIHSVYFRDPNGYVVELSAKQPDHGDEMDPSRNHAREVLDRWQSAKTGA